jgi:hypothetical protein
VIIAEIKVCSAKSSNYKIMYSQTNEATINHLNEIVEVPTRSISNELPSSTGYLLVCK